MVGNKIFTVYLVQLRKIDGCLTPVRDEIKVKANRVEVEDQYIVFYNNFDDVVSRFRKADVIGYVREE